MKKAACILLSLFTCLCFVSCDSGYVVRNKDNEKILSSISLPDIYADMDEEMKAIRQTADTAIADKYKIDDFENYNITIEKGETQTEITYVFRFHGYDTDERFSVVFENETDELLGCYGKLLGYAHYLDKVSEDMLNQAEEKLKALGEGKHGDHIYSVCWDEENYLCLRLLVISEGPLLNGIPMDVASEVFYERLSC